MGLVFNFFVLISSQLGICLQNVLGIPDDGVSVEVLGWIKPEIELLFPASFSLSKNIGVEDVRLASNISEEFEVNFIVGWSLRR